jgi:regulator of sigma E protease
VRRPAAAPEPVDDAQLSPGAWLRRNAVYLVLAVALFAFLYSRFGLGGMWSIALVAIGLGLVIFIHELGHFAVAKWCDVYVQTFSIGFGPALPGCMFKMGETVYKIAVFPLGGYVQMLGEGTDSEGDEDNPRSYKNKRVGQRMLIISAGVIMNVILACVCFIAVFMHGKERRAGEIGWVESGNRAWEKGIRSGDVLTRVGNRVADAERPLYFEDLMSVVVGSAWDEKVTVTHDTYKPGAGPTAQPEHHPPIEIEPRKEPTDDRPLIGVSPAETMTLPPPMAISERPFPFRAGSAAAAARVVPPSWRPGDVILGFGDAEHAGTPAESPQPAARANAELARRWYELAQAGKPITVRFRRAGTQEVKEEPAELGQFKFGDIIVATSDPDHAGEVTELPRDPRHPGSELGDPFEFYRRLHLLADQFVVIRVRHPDQRTEDLLVPPAYHFTLGFRMRMRKVAAIREGSPAEKAGVKKGDIITEIVLKAANGEQKRFVIGDGDPAEVVDPTRLPDDLRQWADAHLDPHTGKGVQALFTVVRDNSEPGPAAGRLPLPTAVDWDSSWRFDEELPLGALAPLAIPELGLAYRIGTVVENILPGSPAASHLQKNDRIEAIRVKQLGVHADEWTDSAWDELGNRREFKNTADKDDQWAHVFQRLQWLDGRQIELKVKGSGKEEQIALSLEPDYTWPVADRGLLLMTDLRVQKASNPGLALVMGVQETWLVITDTYKQLRGFLTGRIGFQNAGGPIKIATLAYSAASMGIWELLFFMGVISINLAVINFLPIPFLDGGHMVFLIYEKIRGRPAREWVMATATYVGLLLLLLLMGGVFYLDIKSLLFKH